jgi:ABC-type multidrug transport system fused ATPase/permease subunit
VIPENHSIFEGSLRFNVDPCGLHDDEKVEKKLKSIGTEHCLLSSDEANGLGRLLAKSNPIQGAHDYRERGVEGNGKGMWYNVGKGVYLSDYEKQLIVICRAALRK